MFTFNYEKDFVIELENSLRYFIEKKREPLLANNLVSKVNKAIDGLKTMPAACSLVESDILEPYGYRTTLAGNYQILFTINEKDKIVNILGSKGPGQNWVAELEKEVLKRNQKR